MMPRSSVCWYAVMLLLGAFPLGCTSPLFRGQSPAAEDLEGLGEEQGEREDRGRLVGDLASPYGWNWLKVQGVALVTNLSGTGSDPPPSPLRERLKKEMQTHDVKGYGRALASPDTSLITVKGYIPPAAQKGDTFDLAVRVPVRSETTSLRGGWMMRCRLRELQMLDTVREGFVEALADGPILVDALYDTSEEEIAEKRGRVLGRAVVQRSRQMGLAIRDEHSSVRTSATIGAAINARFHHFDRGKKKGVANPKRDNVVELAVHPTYRHNIGRYIRVIRNIAIEERPHERTARLAELRRMLTEPTTAELAALRLEAIGKEGVPILRHGLQSDDPEVHFYAAEALTYLDQSEAAEALYEAARNERAFRWRALTALATLDTYESEDVLTRLMNEVSAETRYGAFRALRVRNERDPLVRGEVLNDEFGYHVIASTAEPLIHFARTRRSEIVVFGNDLRIDPPTFLYAGSSILIKGVDPETLRVSCFRPGKEDQVVECSTKLDDLIRTIARVGGGYADVFQALTTAKNRGYLACRIEVDALPSPDRRYDRDEERAESAEDQSLLQVVDPVPEIFMDRLDEPDMDVEGEKEDIDPPQEERTKPGFFGRMTSWFS